LLVRAKALVTLAAVAALPLCSTAAHAVPDNWGVLCGFATVNSDPTNPQNITFTGEMDGETVMLDADDPTNTVNISNTRTTCVIQTTATYGGGGVLVSRSGSGTNIAIVADVVSFDAAPSTPVYLCTTWAWTDLGGPHFVIFDYDVISVNTQCALANSVAVGTTTYAWWRR
jgi:hypothetical protein